MFIQDGYSTFVTPAIALPGGAVVMLREREVQPFEMDGGTPIDTTTMLNITVKTKVAQHLIDFGDITMQCNYDPGVYIQIITSLLNIPLVYTIRFPDRSTLSIFAAMTKFTPASLRIGEFPLAEVKITPVNRTIFGAETLPTYLPGAGPGGSLAWPPVPR